MHFGEQSWGGDLRKPGGSGKIKCRDPSSKRDIAIDYFWSDVDLKEGSWVEFLVRENDRRPGELIAYDIRPVTTGQGDY